MYNICDVHCAGVLDNINQQIAETSHGRLFAVIYINGRQFKVTTEDLILILTNRSFPDVGQRIVIHKVCWITDKLTSRLELVDAANRLVLVD